VRDGQQQRTRGLRTAKFAQSGCGRLTHLTIGIGEQADDAGHRARVADFFEQRHGQAPHERVRVAERGEQRLDGGGVRALAELDERELAERGVGIPQPREGVTRLRRLGGS
jgi:hypothetical protein